MDSDNELFITQSKASNDLEIGSSEFDPEFLLNKIAEGALETSEMSHSKNARNNPYGIDFSDISDDELLITATQEAEKKMNDARFGQPVTEAEVLAKSRKRQVFSLIFLYREMGLLSFVIALINKNVLNSFANKCFEENTA